MASTAVKLGTKFAAKHMLNKDMEKNKKKRPAGDDDPYFAYVEGRNGKRKKVKKQIPDFIPEHDAIILGEVKKSAYRLDMGLFDLLGIRFGWSSVIGLVPELGDVIDVALALKIYKKCCTIDGGLPSSLKGRMMMHVVLDFVVGLVPLIGDLGDAAYKCNTKNVRLLEEYLVDKYKPQGLSDKQKRLSGLQAFDDDPDKILPGQVDNEDSYELKQRGAPGVHPPEESHQPREQKGTGRFFGSKRQLDEEMGVARDSQGRTRK